MPLFGKKSDKKDGEGLSPEEIDASSAPLLSPTITEEDGENLSQEEIDAHYRPDLGRVLRAIPSGETPPVAGAAASGTTSEVSGPGGDGGADDSTEGDDAAESESDGSADGEDDDPSDDDSEGDGPLDDDLMALFTAEEAVDEDLGALTKDLEDVTMADLVTLAREVSAGLKERFPRT